MSFKWIRLFLILVIFYLGACTTYANDNIENTNSHQTETQDMSKKNFSNKLNQSQYYKSLNQNTQNRKRLDVNCDVLESGSSNTIESTIIRSKFDVNYFEHKLNKDTFELLNNVDYNTQAVVIANAGTFTTGGYSIVLDSAVLENNVLNLTFAVLSPPSAAIVTQAFTYPYTIVLVDVDKSINIDMVIVGSQKKDFSK